VPGLRGRAFVDLVGLCWAEQLLALGLLRWR
jgi:hypothetical protein